MFQIEKLKNKTYIVYNKNYRFKEDWTLQAHLLGINKALDWIAFVDTAYPQQVKVNRETYICDIDKVFRGQAGLRLEFLNEESAQNYCNKLNEVYAK